MFDREHVLCENGSTARCFVRDIPPRVISELRPSMSESLKDKLPSFYPSLLRTAERLTTQRADAEDLVQDTFVKALEHLDRLQRPEALAQWLYHIMLRLHITTQRNATREVKGRQRYAESLATFEVPADVELLDLVAVINRLTPKQREAVLAAASTDLPREDLARELGINLSTLESRLNHGRANLRNFL